jgi:DNA modification methylase
LGEWVYGLDSHAEYVERMGDRWGELKPGERSSGEVDYGDYS